MKRFATLLTIASLTFAACASAAEPPLPPAPMPAQMPESVTLPAQLVYGAVRMLEMMSVENAKFCKGPAQSLTWHCDADPILRELVKALQNEQNKQQATKKDE